MKRKLGFEKITREAFFGAERDNHVKFEDLGFYLLPKWSISHQLQLSISFFSSQSKVSKAFRILELRQYKNYSID